MYRFMTIVNDRYGKSFDNYDDLWQWSVDNIPELWGTLWDFMNIVHSRKYDTVLKDGDRMPGSKWFPGAELNFAENLLRYRDGHEAIIFKSEKNGLVTLTYSELYDRVARLARSMREMGIERGDRIAGFMPNMPEAIIAMLASASIGALWSSCSPDFGIKGVLDRFGQIEPRIIFTANGYWYGGKSFNSIERMSEILEHLPSVEKVIVVPFTDPAPDISDISNAVMFDDFASGEDGLEIEFEQLPFEHPLYIMYSSGTTGLPKCMVQSAGGILIHHMKELSLHTDVRREDRIFYFSTCGWMMWNWLTSSLALGATLILFDGSPFYPNPGALFKLADDVGMTIFGTSASYITALGRAELRPKESFDLAPLKAMLSTGSPLHASEFEYVYREIKEDLCLSSISGGTDLNGCFAAGNPMGAVWAGELQCRCLGMNVHAFDIHGNPVIGEQGELVCTSPFPSMPIYFWNDPDGKKYHKAYFDEFPGVWRHGDFIEITEHNGVIVYGRSDATLNPGGVRIGTAEIYRQMAAIDEVADSLVIGQEWKDDVRVVLFVKMAEGAELTDQIKDNIRKTIRKNASPRHVPKKIVPVDDIPYTINMKKVELAVKKIIHGKEVRNQDALKNPEALKLYEDLPELRKD
jgi:acetoacetyl-CoA synthetase